MLDTHSSFEKHQTIIRFIALVLIIMSFISLFLPAFKVSILFANVTVSMHDTMNAWLFWFYIVILAFNLVVVLWKSPFKNNYQGIFSGTLIFTGAFTILLPFVQMSIVKNRVANQEYDEMSANFGEIVKQLINPSFAFIFMCLLGVGMIAVAFIYKYYVKVEETEERSVSYYPNIQKQGGAYNYVNKTGTDVINGEIGEVSPELKEKLRFLLKFHTDDGLIDFLSRNAQVWPEEDRKVVERILGMPRELIRFAIRKIVEKEEP